jgi:uncharacterized protein (DUF736 family)
VSESNQRNVGGGWKKTGKKGDQYISLSLELEGQNGPKHRILMFKNHKKVEGSKQPDYRLVMFTDEGDEF